MSADYWMRSRCTSRAPSVRSASLPTERPGAATGLDLRDGAAQALPTGSVIAPTPRPRTGRFLMGEHELTRRSLMVAPVLLAALAGCGKAGNSNIGPLGISHAAPPDPLQPFVLPYDNIAFQPWGYLPPGSGQMSMLYCDSHSPG